VIHCSAGVGRTGCFLGLCLLAAQVEEQRRQSPGSQPLVSIMQTVLDMRRFRPHMVKTTQQYRLLYEAAAELLK